MLNIILSQTLGISSSSNFEITPFKRKTLPYNLPRFRVQDIDTNEDWKKAELLHKALYA